MKYFITGATGFIGSAVTRDLIASGHQVLGLYRSEASLAKLRELGAEPHKGTLDDLESLRTGALASDGVLHLAFVHDFTDYEESCRTDTRAIQVLGEALQGSNKPLIISSGTLMDMEPGKGFEEQIKGFSGSLELRGASEKTALSFVEKGVRVIVLRLPPTNHGDGDKGFVPALINKARETGISSYIGAGENCWSTVHKDDTAKAYVLAAEKGPAGATYEVVAEPRNTIKSIAEKIGEKLGIPVQSISPEKAMEQYKFLAFPMMCNDRATGDKIQKELGWMPTHLTLMEDLDKGKYFNGQTPKGFEW